MFRRLKALKQLMMNDSWYSVSAKDLNGSGTIDLEASAGHSSPWFDGHFPGEPILPGIAQISIVWDAIRKSQASGAAPVIAEVKRLRFRQIIRPGEKMSVNIEPDRNKPGHYAFKISVKGELACNGVIISGDAANSGS